MTFGTSVMLAPGTSSSTRNRRILAGNILSMSSCLKRCRISKPTMRMMCPVIWVRLCVAEKSDGPCMSDSRKGIRYGRAWETTKWLTLNSCAMRASGLLWSLSEVGVDDV